MLNILFNTAKMGEKPYYPRARNQTRRTHREAGTYTLLKSDVTRRDHVSVVMDAGSRIVNFIVNFIATAQSSHNSEIYNNWCACAVVTREP